jgi:hypothetical protein
MLEEEVPLVEREASPVATEEGVEVEEPTEVTKEPETVMTEVTRITVGVGVGVSALALSAVGVVFTPLVVDSDVLEDCSACVALELVWLTGAAVDTGVED